ncbi:DUF2490 domain-containing protein [Sphingomonas floccifaciens]|uniref:DUF2490 domain-containing protein n=1 Tax=Sphingomonas floccifaciens TaxID=1844115 RepID=A0ABW4NDD6_9SPHN
MERRPQPRLRRVQLLNLARALCAAPLLVVAQPATAQTVEDSQLWWQLNAVAPLSKTVRLTLEQIGRLSDDEGGLYQTEVGTLLGYKANSHVELGFGYRRVGGHNGQRDADEDRIRQHVILTFGRFTGRFRVDERFRDDRPGVGIRIRPLLRYNLPIGRTKGLAAFYSHESFFLPNTTVFQRSGYERMRNIVGVTLPIAKGVSADMGYLNQYRFARAGGRAQMVHALTVQMTLSMTPHPTPKLDD